MTRLLTTARTDIRLQYRNGFYYAVAFVVMVWIVVLRSLPAEALPRLLPLFIWSNMVINTFYFIGGLVLLEKAEGTLETRVVTPLRAWEYMASKVVSLALVSLVESAVILIAGYGFEFSAVPFVIGLVFSAALYSLYGFIVVARYDSINEFLFPSVLHTFLMALPVLNYFGVVTGWLFYLHPLQAPLMLLEAAFRPIEVWQWAYAVAYSLAWIGLLFWLSLRAFRCLVTAAPGVR